ncbi:coiled-coil domain-containing protein 60 [Rhynochetos jubatus]
MPVPAASKSGSVGAAREGRSSSSKAAPRDLWKNSVTKVLATPQALDPRTSVCVEALPGVAQKEGKVLARSRTVYKSSVPTREQVFWEQYHRRQKQFTQGYLTPLRKPYQEFGEIVYIDAKNLTIYALGQLAQEPVKNDAQEKTPKEVAEVTTNKYSFSLKSDLLQPVKRLSSFRETGKELRTLNKALAYSRHHVSSMKRGTAYFDILHQESQERKNTLKADQQAKGTRRTDIQTYKYFFDDESAEERHAWSLTDGNHLRQSGKTEENVTLRSFTPLYTSILFPNPPGAKSVRLLRQLCALHWLLEALTLEPDSLMHSILTCWNSTDPGGVKKTVKEKKDEKFAEYMWEVLITNTKKCPWKTRYRLLSKNINKASTPAMSQLSSQSSPHGQSPVGSANSTVCCSEENIKINVTSSDVTSEPAQAKKQPSLSPFLQKVTQRVREEAAKGAHKEEDVVKKTEPQRLFPGAQKSRVNMPPIKDKESMISKKQSHHISAFIKSKANLCDKMRQKFTAVDGAAACRLQDTLGSLESRQEQRCYQKHQTLKQLKYFRKDMERIRQLHVTDEIIEPEEDKRNWFPVLLARLPESVKSDRYIQKILKKLEKYGKDPDLKIHPDDFLKVLATLQEWELCYPEIAAAVEFVRESIVQMPEEDFSTWFQTRVASLSA